MHFNKTLCSKAWTDLNISFSRKQLRHCCKSTYESFPSELSVDFFNNSNNIIKRRQDLLSGIENSGCNHCWQSYRNTGTAYREHMNQWKSLSDVHNNVEFIEIMLDNLCDMSCVYCNEESSHKIAQEKGLQTKMQTPSTENYKVFLDWLSTVDNEFVLSFLGGEVTYSKNFYNFLNLLIQDNRLTDKQMHLSLMTNGNTNTAQLDKLFKLYNTTPSKWSLLTIFSNESTGELSELVRWGLDWKTYEENFKKYLLQERIELIGLCPTISLFTVNGIVEYLEWALDLIRKHNKRVMITGNWISDSILSPEYSKYTDSAIKIKKLVEQNRDLFITERWYNSCISWTEQFDKILNTKTYDKSQLDTLLQQLAQQKNNEKIYKLYDFIA